MPNAIDTSHREYGLKDLANIGRHPLRVSDLDTGGAQIFRTSAL